MNLFLILLAFIIGCLVGWLQAHSTVATECERLGRFYVGTKTFECVKITDQSTTKIND